MASCLVSVIWTNEGLCMWISGGFFFFFSKSCILSFRYELPFFSSLVALKDYSRSRWKDFGSLLASFVCTRVEAFRT